MQLLSAGAAQGLVRSLAADAVDGRFGAVGAMLEQFHAGAPCDLLILTRAQLDELAQQGELLTGSVHDLGLVSTALAVRSGAALPPVTERNSLRAALLAASSFYVPDLQRSSAGIHIAKVLQSLGITEALADRVRMHPNGATAMRELAATTDAAPLGCTQVTEILYTPGVSLAAELPAEFALATLYSAAVPLRGEHPEAALALARMLAGEGARNERLAGGFMPVSK
jgi:molybdate transport system substrate-binding protein